MRYTTSSNNRTFIFLWSTPRALILISLALAFIAFGQGPGSLDPTFSGDGKLLDGILHSRDDAREVAVQSDGKILVMGLSSWGMSGIALARYNADGTLDTSFDGDGLVTIPLDSGEDSVRSFAIQSDGKIVAAGRVLMRYNPDGSLDTSFGGDGTVVTPEWTANSVLIQPDGKIVTAGSGYENANWYFGLVRYNADGSLDTSFDDDGKVTTTFGSNYVSVANAVTIRPDGRIVAVGFGYSPSSPGARLVSARYNATGSLDTSFGGGQGFVVTVIGSWSVGNAVASQADGKIVVAGNGRGAPPNSNYESVVVRYNTDGSLDNSFDFDGIVTSSISVDRSVAIQADGKIVAAGSGAIGDDFDFALIRYNGDGSLDTSFDGDGIVTTPVGSGDDMASSIAIQSDGRIVAAGSAQADGGDFALVRYNTNGILDTSFEDDGKVITDFGTFGFNRLLAIAIQPDGRIVGGGSTGIVRYNSEGSPDTTFGGGTGKVRTQPVLSLAVQPDGKIVVGGSCYECVSFETTSPTVTRYNPDGSLDTSFANTAYPYPAYGFAYSVHVLPDGKIVVTVGAEFGSEGQILRLNPNGSLDETFGSGDGVASLTVNSLTSSIQSDGKIVIAGFAGGDFAAARLNADGTVDASFDGDGYVNTPIGAGDDRANSIATQSDGKIVAAGYSFAGSNNDIAVVRYNSNGALDTTFNSDGIVTTPIGAGDDVASSVAVQSSGKLVVAGTSSRDFALLRYAQNGSLDTTFGAGDGISTVDFTISNDTANAMTLQGDGRALVVGQSDGAFALARFLLEPRRAPFDFDGDGRSDISVFRPSDSVWYLNRSTEGFIALQFGLSTDKITPADFDGDGKTDIAVFRDGVWWRVNSSDSTVVASAFGIAGDIPVPADYTGDGLDELAVFRNGQWWALDLSNAQSSLINFGLATDKPVPADYDGDGHVDQAVYRNGEWHINRSTLGYTVINFGLASDRPVVGDYDGDGRADLAVYRDGTWYLQQSAAGFSTFQWGVSTDIPTPGDYDGDGKTDAAVFRNGTWYLNRSTGGTSIQQFGLQGDLPVEVAYSP